MLIKQHDFIINSIYIGGGTPSTLTEQQLQKLLAVLKTSIDLKALQEFTFEAGRPNTINAEKLELLKSYQVDRICLNPQTMDNAILEEISRGHTAEDIIETYRLIQQYDFKSINMDLIVGLPQQKLTTFQTTLRTIKALAPENITIHSLAIKRGSYYNKEDYTFENEQLVEQMLDYAYDYLSDTYHPYYLYRQKNILANLENVGFAKEGYASVYNVRIIEEKNSIIACGAGATSKFSYPDRDRFDRVPNIKGLEQYMARVEEMVERKQQAFSNII
jgi:oxygen-independent coproporphyrinogen-3 oxidase